MDLEVNLMPMAKNEERLLKGGFGEVASFQPAATAKRETKTNTNALICFRTCRNGAGTEDTKKKKRRCKSNGSGSSNSSTEKS